MGEFGPGKVDSSVLFFFPLKEEEDKDLISLVHHDTSSSTNGFPYLLLVIIMDCGCVIRKTLQSVFIP